MNDAGEGWFVADAEGNARGPLTRAQLLAEREAGRVGDAHLVWTLASAEWVPLRSLLGGPSAAAARQPATPPPPVKPEPPRQAARKMPRPQPAAPLPGTAPARSSDDWRERAGARPAAALAQRLATAAEERERQQKLARAGESMRRWLARQADTVLLGGIGWALLAVLGWKLGSWSLGAPSAEIRDNLLLPLILLAFSAVVLEALLVGLFGVTPARALLGLRVTGADGRAPGLRLAGERAARVAIYGQALQVFPFVLVAWAIAAGTLAKEGRTHWDRVLDLRVQVQPITAQRWWASMALTGAAWAMFLGDGWMRLAAELMRM